MKIAASFVLATVLFAPVVQAQDTTSSSPPVTPAKVPGVPTSARPSAVAAARTGEIKIDGRLDDPAWAVALPVTDFKQQKPNEGEAPTEKTEVRILYDADAIYVGARMYDSHGAAGVTTMLTRHDADTQCDILRIDFDPYHDRLHSVEFDVNPSGWRGDATDVDRSWDPVWEAASNIDSLGWTTEVRIPFSQLRFSRQAFQTWGLNLTRIIYRNQERDVWAFWKQNEVGGPAFFGDLTGLEVRGGTRHGELLPYVVGRTKRLNSGDPQSPFFHRSATDMRVGGDAKYLLTNSFTLAATVNPDFGQVEVDPAVVNLSQYETFFPELRPFFVEGSDVFNFGQPGCNINCGFGLGMFYSRRIGRPPQGAGLAFASGPFADVPENTDILGAAKLTGRTASGYTVGMLDAVTSRETAEVETAAGVRIEQPVEPLANNLIARGKRDMRNGNIVLGGILTSVDRRLDDPGLESLLPNSARTAGADADFYWLNHTYHLYTAVSASRVTGDSLAIARLERSPARYFQRPDRRVSGGLFSSAYDTSANSLSGYGAISRLSKQSGKWQGDLNAAAISPGFETNDLGFLQNADWRWINGTFGPVFTKPTKFYRSAQMLLGAEKQWNYDGDATGADATAFLESELLDYWQIVLIGSHTFAAISDRLTRGGPDVRTPAANVALAEVSTDKRRHIILNTTVSASKTDDGGSNSSIDLSASIRPAPNVQLTLGPGYSHSTTMSQYVAQITDPTATTFYGSRYVFSHLEQKQVYMTVRGAVTFTPSLSLDIFAQPLIASGNYTDFEEYAAPRQKRLLVYGKDVGTITTGGQGGSLQYTIDPDGAGPAPTFTLGNPNFNFRSLRGTSVLRWEWRPGSTAYLVWTQTRSDTAPLGDLSFVRDRSALFSAPADNIFVLKISYWLGM
jgi:hypothetical protein